MARTFQIVRRPRPVPFGENVGAGLRFGARNGPAPLPWTRPAFSADRLAPVGTDRPAPDAGAAERLEVARALATGPQLLLLDEVMAGLTPAEVQQMIAMVRSIRSGMGVTVMIIEHVMGALMALSDHVVVLDHGETIAAGGGRRRRSGGPDRLSGAPAMNDGALLDVRGLAGGYGPVKVLHGIDFSVPGGRITALVGGNGAGKTTAMAMLAGLLEPDSGTIRYGGSAVEGWGSARRVAAGIVLVPEGRLVFPDMTVEENLRLGAINRQARRHTADGMEQVYAQFPRLGERRRQSAGTLSGGEQQMSRGPGLMSRPRILLLDEPSWARPPMWSI